MYTLPTLFLVFDVESIGLHGEGFAVGYVVKRIDGEHMADGCFACPLEQADGNWQDREWVKANVPPIEANCELAEDVRSRFWAVWREWQVKGAVLVADCAWPVEARFLAACVDDAYGARNWEGPYPLHDLASVLLAHGLDPLETRERLPDELPAHHPVNDAMQSARILVERLSKLQPRYAAPVLLKSVEAVGEALLRFHQALDRREHAYHAAYTFACEVEKLFGRPWKQGATLGQSTPMQTLPGTRLQWWQSAVEFWQQCYCDTGDTGTSRILEMMREGLSLASQHKIEVDSNHPSYNRAPSFGLLEANPDDVIRCGHGVPMDQRCSQCAEVMRPSAFPGNPRKA